MKKWKSRCITKQKSEKRISLKKAVLVFFWMFFLEKMSGKIIFWGEFFFEFFFQKKIEKNLLKILFLIFFSKKNWKKNLKKNYLSSNNYLEYILSKFQVVPTTASQKRGLTTTVQIEPDFSRTCGFCEVIGINEDCSNAKFCQNP